MSYVYDGTTSYGAPVGTVFPKTDKLPVPSGESLDQWCKANDWNILAQCIIDIRAALRQGIYYGFEQQSSDPAPSGYGGVGQNGYLWISSSDHKLHLHVNGSDAAVGTTPTLQLAYNAGSSGPQVITEDGTRKGVIFKNSSGGSTTVFGVQAEGGGTWWDVKVNGGGGADSQIGDGFSRLGVNQAPTVALGITRGHTSNGSTTGGIVKITGDTVGALANTGQPDIWLTQNSVTYQGGPPPDHFGVLFEYPLMYLGNHANHFTNAATLKVTGAPQPGSPGDGTVIDNAYAIWSAAGLNRFEGPVQIGNDSGGNTAYFQMGSGASAAVSPSGSLRLRKNGSDLELSVDGGSYAALLTGGGGGGGVTGTGTTDTIAKWTGTTSVGNSSITDNGTVIGLAIDTTLTSGKLFKSGSNTLIGSISDKLNAAMLAIASQTIGDLLYADSTTTFARRAAVASGSYLRSAGTGTAPVWSTLVLPNSGTTGDLLYVSSSNTVTMLPIGSTDQVLTVIAGVPTWTTIAGAGGVTTSGLTTTQIPKAGSSSSLSDSSIVDDGTTVSTAELFSLSSTSYSPSTATNTVRQNNISTFSPSSSSPKFIALQLNPTINGTSSGFAKGLVIASKTNTLTGGTIYLMDLGTTTTDGFTGFTSKLSVDTSGNTVAAGTVTSTGAFTASSTTALQDNVTLTSDKTLVAGSNTLIGAVSNKLNALMLAVASTQAIGDILTADSTTTYTNIAANSAGKFLRAAGTGTQPAWSTLVLPNAATAGDLPYASASNTVSMLAAVASGSYLRSAGTSTAPVWSTVTIPNAATTGDIWYASGTNVVSALGIGSSNQILQVVGGVPTWQTVAVGSGTVSSGTTNTLAKYTASTTVGNSNITDDGTTIVIGGTNFQTSTGGLDRSTSATLTLGGANSTNLILKASNATMYTIIGTVAGAIAHDFAQPVNTSGTPTGVRFVSAAHTGLSNADTNGVLLDTSASVQFGQTTTLASQRNIYIKAPTYTATSATKTITTAATFEIDAAPTAGTNVAITSPLAMHVAAGNARFAGVLQANGGVDRSSAATLSIGTTNANAIAMGNGTITTTITGALTVSSSGIVAVTSNGNYGLAVTNNVDATLKIGPVATNQARIYTDQSGRYMTFADGAGSTDVMAIRNGKIAVGSNFSPGYPIDIQATNSGNHAMSVRNLDAAGFSTLVFADSGNTQRGSLGYANSSVGAPFGGFFYINASTIRFIDNGQGSGTFHTLIEIKDATTGSPNFVAFTQQANTANTPVGLLWSSAAHTTLANAEVLDQNFNNARTVQFGQNTTLATQRSFLVQAPTYSSNTATKTITTAATFAISGAPTQGTNVSFGSAYALWVQAGQSEFDGNVVIGSSNTFTTGTGAVTLKGATSLDSGKSLTSSGGAANLDWRSSTGQIKTSGMRYQTTSQSGNYTITTGDVVIFCTAGGFTLTLPSPSNAGSGAFYYIVDTGGNFFTSNMTLARNGSEKINGTAANVTLTTSRGFYIAMTDGTDWYVEETGSLTL